MQLNLLKMFLPFYLILFIASHCISNEERNEENQKRIFILAKLWHTPFSHPLKMSLFMEENWSSGFSCIVQVLMI